MKISFVFVGGQKEDWVQQVADEYVKKIGYFFPTEIVRLKPTKMPRASREQKVEAETAAILKQIGKDDIVVVCDEKGDSVSSKKLSEKIVKLIERGRPRLVFLIGGAFGFGPEVLARADWKWSFSPLTFNHHLAQAIVLEQIYRAMTIWKNLPYHNE